VAIKRKTITHSSVRKSEISRATFRFEADSIGPSAAT